MVYRDFAVLSVIDKIKDDNTLLQCFNFPPIADFAATDLFVDFHAKRFFLDNFKALHRMFRSAPSTVLSQIYTNRALVALTY